MKRLWVQLFLSVLLTVGFAGCSLFGSSDEATENAEVANDDELEKDEADEAGDSDELGDSDKAGEGDDSGESDELGDSEEAGDDTDVGKIDVDSELEDDGGDEFPDDASGSDDMASAEVSDDDFADAGTAGAGEDVMAVDEGDSGGEDLPAEPMNANQEQDLFAKEDAGDGDNAEPTAGSASAMDMGDTDSATYGGLVSVKKMKAAAYSRAGSNVNRLYVVRAGDDIKAVSQKIFGADRSKDLYAVNSHFAGRSLNIGDKVYYSSPNSPNDREMKTFYEDNGIAPQYYTSQRGENIHEVAEKLLGHKRSWMELYATNEGITSKWALPAGTQIRYWPEGAATMAAAPTPAPAPAPPVAEPMDEGVEEVAEASPEEIPAADPAEVQEVAQLDEPGEEIAEITEDEFAPPAAGATVAPPPPPPPSANDAVPPPPPPPPAPLARNNKPFKATQGPTNPGDDSMIMGALGGLLILAAIILLVFIRRGRAKRVNFSQTQV